MTIQQEKVVTMHYHLTGVSGEVIDSSRGSDPLTYLHGAGNLVPGLERELTGMAIGMTKTIEVDPADGYGEYDESMVETVPRQALEGIENLTVGMELQAQSEDGCTTIVQVVEVGDDAVVIDANHPLAGAVLTFEVEIVDIRDATREELSHGHVHGAGEDHH